MHIAIKTRAVTKCSGLMVKKTFILRSFRIHLQQVTEIIGKDALLLQQLKLPLFNQLDQDMCHAHFKGHLKWKIDLCLLCSLVIVKKVGMCYLVIFRFI